MAYFGCIGKPEEEKTVTALLEQLIVTPEPGENLKKSNNQSSGHTESSQSNNKAQ